MSKLFHILFILVFVQTSGHSAEIRIQEKPLDHPELVKYNINYANYAAYQRAFNDSLTDFFKDWKGEQSIKIIQSLAPDLPPYYGFSAKPALTEEVKNALFKKLTRIGPLNTDFLPYATEFTVLINGGSKNRGLDFSPLLKTPREMRKGAYEFAPLNENRDLIKRWVDEGALPLLTVLLIKKSKEYANITPPIYSPTVNSTVNSLKKDILESPDVYWRTLETYADQPQLMPVYKTFLLISNGQFSYAEQYKQLIYQFESSETLLRYLLDELSWRMNYYFQKEHATLSLLNSMKKGDRLTERKEILDSLIRYDSLNTAFLYQRIDKLTPVIVSDYSDSKLALQFEISNPLHSDTLASYSKETRYFNYLRSGTADLFVDAETFEDDFATYAEIALKLGVYDLAADLYFMLHQDEWRKIDEIGVEPREMALDMVEKVSIYKFRFDYALYRLGIRSAKTKKEKKRFKRLSKKLRKEVKRFKGR